MLILDHFWCSLVTSVTFSSNLSNFEKNSKHPKKFIFFQTILFQIKNVKKKRKKIETNPKNRKRKKIYKKMTKIKTNEFNFFLNPLFYKQSKNFEKYLLVPKKEQLLVYQY